MCLSADTKPDSNQKLSASDCDDCNNEHPIEPPKSDSGDTSQTAIIGVPP
jgi:hypothetical protein